MSSSASNILSKIEAAVEQVSSTIEKYLNDVKREELSAIDRVRHDLFLAYALNCTFWMYLRINGEDPNESIIKTELTRIKELLNELQKTIDRKTIMPRLDQGAAKRFVKHGLAKNKDHNNEPKRKHIRFSDPENDHSNDA